MDKNRIYSQKANSAYSTSEDALDKIEQLRKQYEHYCVRADERGYAVNGIKMKLFSIVSKWKRIHQGKLIMSVDLDKIVKQYALYISHTFNDFMSDGYEGIEESFDGAVLFLLPDRTVLVVERDKIQVYAQKQDKVEKWVRTILAEFKRKEEQKEETSGFHVLVQGNCGIERKFIEASMQGIKSREEIDLLYGESFSDWNQSLVKQIKKSASGIVLFEGPPGTGKTTYIRHLMRELLKDTCFYYLPNQFYGILTNPRMMEFWIEQGGKGGKRAILVLEDAEELLLNRRSNLMSSAVAQMLSMGDGLLGDVLKMQVICTVNAATPELDPALLRSGRLLARRHFGRHPREQALAIAEHYGKALPEGDTFSLAEIFKGPDMGRPIKKSMGFLSS